LNLYGGASYERLMNEFELVSHSMEFPKTSLNEVGSALGTAKYHNAALFETAASDIVQTKARKVLMPLIDCVLTRCEFIMMHLFDITIQAIIREEGHIGLLGKYEEFIKELRTVYQLFINRTRINCETKATDDFSAFTKILDWDLLSGLKEINDYDYLNCSQEDTKKRIESLMKEKGTLSSKLFYSRQIDNETYQSILQMAGKLFAGVRYFFTKLVRAKFNAFFLDPMFQQLGRELTDHFRKMTDKRYEELFNLGVAHLQKRVVTLHQQLEKFTQQRNRFKELLNTIKSLSD
jgi:hypothetical protein